MFAYCVIRKSHVESYSPSLSLNAEWRQQMFESLPASSLAQGFLWSQNKQSKHHPATKTSIQTKTIRISCSDSQGSMIGSICNKIDKRVQHGEPAAATPGDTDSGCPTASCCSSSCCAQHPCGWKYQQPKPKQSKPKHSVPHHAHLCRKCCMFDGDFLEGKEASMHPKPNRPAGHTGETR